MSSDKKIKRAMDLFTALAEELDRVTKAILGKGDGDCAIPSVEEIEDLLKKINKEFGNPKKLRQSDFAIKKGNELSFVGMYLKAAKTQEKTGMTDRLSALSKTAALGNKERGFVNNGYKEAIKRLM